MKNVSLKLKDKWSGLPLFFGGGGKGGRGTAFVFILDIYRAVSYAQRTCWQQVIFVSLCLRRGTLFFLAVDTMAHNFF